ncbi:MAG: Hsp20/alpha crystallin family protein [Calothrix sp. SM1_5_4]|nr:Hsp20/alpha crystallin family protein [Calothrix sp. SM1_5_4]
MNIPALWRRTGHQPIRALSRIQNDFERLFEEIADTDVGMTTASNAPACELAEDNANYVMWFDLPGVRKEDVKIELDGNQLTVSAERQEQRKADGRRSRFSEITYGVYQRTFTLPTTVDEKRVDAKFDNGVLTLTMPKVASAKVKQIAIH